ncbi:uncharacterized protein LOC131148705 isoform X2 [Malania oleifera]|uniref:uncharacterized protein LOC131148705 isoform X2 n=1 Tax=Malania oleifera TaxID=397392 RepID=UPI0025AEC56D|nr:uncharacterized protein LOC131148705 isoform X2 [Malania oleifera]XP_057954578.1 uncharacterized protein LOC131148705 isoform X2 [Malania oleifera]
MAWLLIAISLILPWVASLCKILHASNSPSKAAFLSRGDALHKRNVLLVVAHPDDESMFFSPTLSYLTSAGHNIHILCMSTGNADGMGNTRKEELFQACAVLKDGFSRAWDHNLLAKIIKDEVTTHAIELIITFDNYGVSGHCNHRDVHYGIRKLLPDIMQRNIEVWELVSNSILRKYSGPVDIWLSILYATHYSSGQLHCLLNVHPRKSFLAMSQHRSQWVWFRKLFVSFSSYTYVNTLRKIM